MRPKFQHTFRVCINKYDDTYEVIVNGDISACSESLAEATELALSRYYMESSLSLELDMGD